MSIPAINIPSSIVTIIPGNDYLNSLSTQLSFTSPYAGVTFTSLTYNGQIASGGTLAVTGVLTSGSAGYIELSATISIQLVQGTFSVLGKTAGGQSLTWAQGIQIVQPVRS